MIDNHFSDFRDHQLSANPSDMKKLVGMIRDLDTIKKAGVKCGLALKPGTNESVLEKLTKDVDASAS